MFEKQRHDYKISNLVHYILFYTESVSDVIEPLPMLSKIVTGRAIRRELKTLQEAPVLQAMEKEMARPSPDVGTLRQATYQ